MSTVEATSGTTTTHPHHPSSAVRDRALALGVLAVLAGIGAIVTAVWDWARDADIPNTLPTMLGIVAAGAGIAAVLLHTSHRQAVELARLADEIERITPMNGHHEELPPGVAAQIYQLGRRSGGRNTN